MSERPRRVTSRAACSTVQTHGVVTNRIAKSTIGQGDIYGIDAIYEGVNYGGHAIYAKRIDAVNIILMDNNNASGFCDDIMRRLNSRGFKAVYRRWNGDMRQYQVPDCYGCNKFATKMKDMNFGS